MPCAIRAEAVGGAAMSAAAIVSPKNAAGFSVRAHRFKRAGELDDTSAAEAPIRSTSAAEAPHYYQSVAVEAPTL